MFEIRLASPADRAALYRICLETADSGADGTHLYQDPLLVGHLYAGPYLEFAPEYVFVLEDDAGVCGYVLGVLDTSTFETRLEHDWRPALRAQYLDPVNVRPQERTPDEGLMHLIHHPPVPDPGVLSEYPSHLHIDLLPRGQGKGQGRQLLERLFSALREAGSPGVHLGVGGRNTRAQSFYRHLGFSELRGFSDGGLILGLKL
ncbi:N-acetyltransferase (plasmid) [Deinococcus metallilatus]|uniref:GNAT family N-acetyltransferase n=1 Tax=Deinococcus metallilatus TaxID=1211322 RepID=A0AAJ5K6W2_9DEIO|nr:GNAT family N-acetyltransferase [Deinococcus metallilatus]MBB5295692.1 ribosomal protein S18 acetylase RimI-like enzyme [Deinococcus metallilatus]QBY06857.1 N-acetyltransferase [Deinococcus metallilatus]TLK32246.1 GNAT family N-acetyltransferase [Deinococcus metallilatus]GMA14223.1 N-acetyltransferase [Deinococcus metallilatus]